MPAKNYVPAALLIILILSAGCINDKFESDKKAQESSTYRTLYWDMEDREILLRRHIADFDMQLSLADRTVFCINNGAWQAYLDYDANYNALLDFYSKGIYLKNEKKMPEKNTGLVSGVKEYCGNITTESYCPEGFSIKKGKCIKLCADGTLYGECGNSKPLYCDNGNLILKASICGCPEEETAKGEECISVYAETSFEREFRYTLRSKEDSIKFAVYKELNDYLAALPRVYYCNPECPADEELELGIIDEKKQSIELDKLAETIKEKTNSVDDRARIAIALVQAIPYDWVSFEETELKNRYPYEVLYVNKGTCGEKSRLLAYLLRTLGYGVVLFRYDDNNHMSAGIKCPLQYSQYKSGYCFIETTTPSIMTDIEGDYVNAGKLSDNPRIFFISSGNSFDNVMEEYNDAKEFREIASQGQVLPEDLWDRWNELVTKYGFVFD